MLLLKVIFSMFLDVSSWDCLAFAPLLATWYPAGLSSCPWVTREVWEPLEVPPCLRGLAGHQPKVSLFPPCDDEDGASLGWAGQIRGEYPGRDPGCATASPVALGTSLCPVGWGKQPGTASWDPWVENAPSEPDIPLL